MQIALALLVVMRHPWRWVILGRGEYPVKCDPRLLVVGVDKILVAPALQPPDEATAVVSFLFGDGETVHFGLTTAALEELCTALIDKSPRVPGTPGRN